MDGHDDSGRRGMTALAHRMLAGVRTRDRTAGLISIRMTIAMAVVTMLGGVAFMLGVLLGSRHEFIERGLDPDTMSVDGQFGDGMMVIDIDKAIGFTILSIIAVVMAVAAIGWHYSRKEVEPLERALDLQRDFVADASHELKTPLAVIAARIDLIDFRHAHGQDIGEPLDALRGDVDRMSAIITDLLTAARGAVASEPVALADVVDQSVDAVRPLAAGRDVTIDTRVYGERGRYIVRGNATGLSRCLVAVLDNAVAHSPCGGTVDVVVSTGRTRRRAATAEVRVCDRGDGIGGDPERLFRRFARDDDGTAHQGYGLGLALARDVASRYGGTIGVESSSPHGTTMLITLPLEGARA